MASSRPSGNPLAPDPRGDGAAPHASPAAPLPRSEAPHREAAEADAELGWAPTAWRRNGARRS